MRNDQRIFNKDFILLFIVNFVSHAGLQMFASIMSKYASSLGFPDALLGLVVSAYAFMIFATSLFSGSFIDRANKKGLLLFAMFAQPLAVLGYAFLASNMFVLILLRLFHGFCAGLISIVTMAMVAFVLPIKKMGLGMGIYGLGQTIAMAVGPSVGITLVERIGFRDMFLIAFVVVALAALLSLFVVPVPTVKTARKKFSFRDLILVDTVPISLLGFLNNTAYASLTAYIVLHADQQGISNISLFYTVYAIVLLASRPLIGRISDRMPLKTIIYPSSLLILVAMLLCAYATNLWMLLLAAVLMAIGIGGSQPAIQATSIREAPPEKRGAASATFMMGQSLGFIVGPMGGGYIASKIGFNNMYAVMSGTAVLCILLMSLIEIRRRRTAASLDTTA